MSEQNENPVENKADYLRTLDDDVLNKGYLKVNLPDNMRGYQGGNGEGCWAYPLTEEDARIIEEDKSGQKAKIILCNHSFYFPPLVYGSVLQVEMRPGFRPVLDIYWLHELLNPTGIDFLAILNGEVEDDEEEDDLFDEDYYEEDED